MKIIGKASSTLLERLKNSQKLTTIDRFKKILASKKAKKTHKTSVSKSKISALKHSHKEKKRIKESILKRNQDSDKDQIYSIYTQGLTERGK